MKRDDLVQEMLLRENIRKIIKVVKTRQKEKESKKAIAEQMLRKIIRSALINEAAIPDEIPNRSTGINVLEDLNADAGVLVKEDIDINIDDKGDDRFIDIDPKGKEDIDPKDSFASGLEDTELDQTGRNVAFNTFKKVEQNILDSYELLSDAEDKKIFYDYLLTNTKLYFDKFEDELADQVPDITTPEYEKAAGDEADEDVESAELQDTEL